MSLIPKCPMCSSDYAYEAGTVYACPECGHEWSMSAALASPENQALARVVKDAHGSVLADGDSVTLVKDLKVKGSSLVIKVGTKVKRIRIIEGDHDIDCKIDGVGAMQLKSEFVKKA